MSVEQIPPSTTPVSGSVTVVQPTGSNLHTVVDSGTITTVASVTAIAGALPAGANVIGHVITDSGSTTAVTGSVTVTGPLTDTQLRASAVPVSLAAAPSTVVTQGTSPWVVGQATAASLNATVVGTGTFATQTTLSAGTAIVGTVYDEPDDTWHQTHVPAANTQATITQASAGGSLKNVCTGFTVTICAGATAPTAIQLTVALIDGATGGTTYLWRSNIAMPAASGGIVAFHSPKGKWTGSAATAMTLEFSIAGGGNTFESVTMKGYTK